MSNTDADANPKLLPIFPAARILLRQWQAKLMLLGILLPGLGASAFLLPQGAWGVPAALVMAALVIGTGTTLLVLLRTHAAGRWAVLGGYVALCIIPVLLTTQQEHPEVPAPRVQPIPPERQ